MTGQVTNEAQSMGWGGACAAMERRGAFLRGGQREGDLETANKGVMGKRVSWFLNSAEAGQGEGTRDRWEPWLAGANVMAYSSWHLGS